MLCVTLEWGIQHPKGKEDEYAHPARIEMKRFEKMYFFPLEKSIWKDDTNLYFILGKSKANLYIR